MAVDTQVNDLSRKGDLGGIRRMFRLVRVRWRACLLAALVVVTLPAVGARAAAPPAPIAYRFDGGGYGHGIGMSQYGAYGMALNGYSAAGIIAHYYRGAAASRAALPRTISVGLLQAGLDPLTGGRLSQVLVHGLAPPGARRGPVRVSGYGPRREPLRRDLPGGVTYSIRPDAGGAGMSVFGPAGRVFGPARLGAGAGLLVRYQAASAGRPFALLRLPQARLTLRWGRVFVRAVRDDQRHWRPRAVLSIGVNTYLRGLGEMPSSWPTAALRAQAIAARSYALAAAGTRGQHRGRAVWSGCDCALYADTRDQSYRAWSKESGLMGRRWVSAVDGTGSLVVRYGGRVVAAFYSSSSGGRTQSNAAWGGAPLPYLPVQADRWDCASVGRHCASPRNPNWRWRVERPAAEVSRLLAPLGVGAVHGIRVTRLDRAARVRTARVSGGRGAVTVAGATLVRLLGLRSRLFTVTALR
jgi:SpoIID/LytB domain protein